MNAYLDSKHNEKTLTQSRPMNNMDIRGTASVQDSDLHQGDPFNA